MKEVSGVRITPGVIHEIEELRVERGMTVDSLKRSSGIGNRTVGRLFWDRYGGQLEDMPTMRLDVFIRVLNVLDPAPQKRTHILELGGVGRLDTGELFSTTGVQIDMIIAGSRLSAEAKALLRERILTAALAERRRLKSMQALNNRSKTKQTTDETLGTS